MGPVRQSGRTFLFFYMQDLSLVYQHFSKSSGPCTDTRKLKPDCFFIALRGPNFDANRFADEALKSGASACLVDDPALSGKSGYIYVPNTLTGLHRLAHYHRKRFHIPVIGLTGSNGKTTTKELITAVLSQKYKVHATMGNLNNHIGVPITLLEMGEDMEIGIIEMGANQPGEIRMLCKLANPDFGVITNVGKAHLEGFGSLAMIRQTKYELLDHITLSSGVFFHNSDETSLDDLKEINSEGMVRFGSDDLLSDGKWKIDKYEIVPAIKITISNGREELLLRSALFGAHNLQNIKVALAVGAHFNVPIHLMIQAISEYVPQNNRSQIVQQGNNTYYMDAYNANPSSMSKGLEFFDQLPHDEKILILGDMLELGKISQNEHLAIIDKARKMEKVQQILLVGHEFANAADKHVDPRISCFDEVDQLQVWLDKQNWRAKHIFVKGSRGIHLENILSGVK